MYLTYLVYILCDKIPLKTYFFNTQHLLIHFFCVCLHTYEKNKPKNKKIIQT